MKILAIDTSSKICSVCILEDKNLIMEKHNNDEKTHSQKLMPLIDELFKETNLNLTDIDLLSSCIGPGSFTGLRIGISTVKAFSDVTNAPIIGISSLESLAYNIKTNGLIACIIDAKNDNVYFALYNLENNVYSLKEDLSANNISDVITILQKYQNENITFVGDGSIYHKNTILQNFDKAIFAETEQNTQSSISIALAAYDKFQKGYVQNSSTLSPLYLRKSQAERALDGEK